MNLKLYELADQYQRALAELPEVGLDEQTIADTLEGLEGAVTVKAQNVAAYCLNLDAEADAVEAAGKKLIERARAIRARHEGLRAYLYANMKRCGITEIRANDGTFKAAIRQNPEAVDIVAPEAIPESMQRVIPERREPDKAAIKEALKAGIDVPGARLVRGERLEIK